MTSERDRYPHYDELVLILRAKYELADDEGLDYWDRDLHEYLVDQFYENNLPEKYYPDLWAALVEREDWFDESELCEFMFNPSCRYCHGGGTIPDVTWVPYGNGMTAMDTSELCDCYTNCRY